MTNQTNPPADFPLDPRKRAIVVGASSGIGAAIVRKLTAEGYQVAALARRLPDLQQVCEDANQAAGETLAKPYKHDVTQFASAPALFQQILKDMQRVDALIYVSGSQPDVGLSEYDFAKDQLMVETNVLGAMAWMGVTASFFERMGKGQIVGISSVAADRGRVANPGYHASKAGMTVYMESLRNRLTRHSINVLTVKPGHVETALLEGVAKKLFPISPDQAAADIYKAMRRRKQSLYTPWWWRYLMLVIQHIPSFIFRRLSF